MGENKRLTKHYYDLIQPRKVDTRTPQEITADIMRKYGLRTEDE